MPTPDEIDRLYREGVAAVRRGDKAAARDALLAVTGADPFHEQAWLWLGGVVETDAERITCLENVLALNPGHEQARRALEKLRPAPSPTPAAPAEAPDWMAAITQQPAAEPERPTLTHAAAPAVGAELNALVSGEKPPPRPKADLRPGEEWRAALFEAEHVTSTATLVQPHVEPPPTTFRDMVRVWGELVILFRIGNLETEVARGGLLHSIASIGAAALLRLVGTLLLLLVLFISASGRWQPPLLRSLDALAARSAQLADLEAEAAGTIIGAFDLLNVDIVLPSEMMDATARGARTTGRDVARSAGIITLTFIAGVLPGMLIEQMFSAVFVNLVALQMLNGHGNYGRTLQALALALVAGEIVQLPVMLLTPFMPVAVLLTVYGGLAIYRWVVAGVALDAAHEVGLLGGIGGMVMGWIASGMAAGICMTLINLLVS